MLKYLLASAFALMLFLGMHGQAQAWTLQDCIAIHYQHPDCIQYIPTPGPNQGQTQSQGQSQSQGQNQSLSGTFNNNIRSGPGGLYFPSVEAAGPCGRPVVTGGAYSTSYERGGYVGLTVPIGRDKGCLNSFDQKCIAYLQSGYILSGCPTVMPIVTNVATTSPAPELITQKVIVVKTINRSCSHRSKQEIQADLKKTYRMFSRRPSAEQDLAMERLERDCGLTQKVLDRNAN